MTFYPHAGVYTRPDTRKFAAVTALLIGRRGFLKVVVQLTEGGRRIQTAITAALDATDGNVRKVQKLSRHRKLDTLMIYDDNRGRDQHDITFILDGMFWCDSLKRELR